MSTLVFYISGHGFGHAARDIEIINTLHDRAPGVRIIVRTAAPRWLFDVTLRAPIDWEPLECDTGVVQVDSLSVDVEQTIRQAAAFHATLDARAEAEAGFLRRRDVSLVVGDIPPLAFLAAHLAGRPSVALGNFTWDWIYGEYAETAARAPGLVKTLGDTYAHTDLALRLPLHAGFAPFRRVQDVPLVARRSRRTPGELRRYFGLPADEVLVLPSFGGYGLRGIDIEALGRVTGYTLVITADLGAARRGSEMETGTGPSLWLPGNARLLDERDLYAAGFLYEDLVAAVDVVATKPGYSIIAECISNEDLIGGVWQAPLDRLMRQSAPQGVDANGADVVAEAISAWATSP
jgi:L-arabinokinase